MWFVPEAILEKLEPMSLPIIILHQFSFLIRPMGRDRCRGFRECPKQIKFSAALWCSPLFVYNYKDEDLVWAGGGGLSV